MKKVGCRVAVLRFVVVVIVVVFISSSKFWQVARVANVLVVR
jgi:hypothetical protein